MNHKLHPDHRAEHETPNLAVVWGDQQSVPDRIADGVRTWRVKIGNASSKNHARSMGSVS